MRVCGNGEWPSTASPLLHIVIVGDDASHGYDAPSVLLMMLLTFTGYSCHYLHVFLHRVAMWHVVPPAKPSCLCSFFKKEYFYGFTVCPDLNSKQYIKVNRRVIILLYFILFQIGCVWEYYNTLTKRRWIQKHKREFKWLKAYASSLDVSLFFNTIALITSAILLITAILHRPRFKSNCLIWAVYMSTYCVFVFAAVIAVAVLAKNFTTTMLLTVFYIIMLPLRIYFIIIVYSYYFQLHTRSRISFLPTMPPVPNITKPYIVSPDEIIVQQRYSFFSKRDSRIHPMHQPRLSLFRSVPTAW